MTANAHRDTNTEKEFLAPIAGKVAESVLAIMQYFGIQKIDVKRFSSANCQKIFASPTMFAGAPDELLYRANAVKDAIAEVLASVGIVDLEIVTTDEEKQNLVKSYAKLLEVYRTPTAKGSAKDAAPDATTPQEGDKEPEK